MKKKDTSWGGVADWYDGLLEENADSFQAKVIMPNLLRLLEPKPDQKILDVACGQGYFSRAFAQNGAKVTACDISPELIAAARARSLAKPGNGSASGPTIDYRVAPADDLGLTEEAVFDAATIILAIQNIENLTGTLQTVSQALKPGGRLLLVLNHPAFRIPQSSSWQWDEAAGKQYRRIDAYLSERQIKIDMTPGEAEVSRKRFTISFHRPLQVYFKALAKAGFRVGRLEEWLSHRRSEKGPRSAEEDRLRKEIPLFLFLEAEKR